MNTPPVVPTPVKDAECQALCVLYQVTAADIVFFKQQQWMVMNYAVGLDTALVVLAPRVLGGAIAPVLLWGLLVLACAVPAVASLMLRRLHHSIEVRRTRLQQTRALLGPTFQQAWSVPKEPDDFYLVFQGVLAVSWLVTLWLVMPSK